MKSARAGQPIDESEIPPEVFVASQASAPAPKPQPPPQQVPVRAPSPPRQVPQPAAAASQPRVVRLPQPTVVSPSKQNPVPSRRKF